MPQLRRRVQGEHGMSTEPNITMEATFEGARTRPPRSLIVDVRPEKRQ